MNLTTSFLAGLFKGAPLSFQSGISSFNAVGSKTLPESIWAPISEPFSIRQMLNSLLFSFANCASFMALLNPDGPAPTITTS